MELRRVGMVVAGLVFIVGSALLYGAGNDEDVSRGALEQQLKELLKTRAESAKIAFDAMQASFEAETVTFYELADASKKLTEAEMALANQTEAKTAALQRYVERAKQVERKIKLLQGIGTKGGEANAYYSAKRERESAEIWLLKTRMKATQ